MPPEETGRYLRAIQGKAEALTELVNAFHEYSKVEHPEFVLHTERTDLCEFLREYLAGKYDEIDLAGFSLEVSIPERPVFCALDQLQFRRVLDNLLSNALRHNRLGTILFFDVSVEEGAAVLRVADNGSGIPADRAKYIFEPLCGGQRRPLGHGQRPGPVHYKADRGKARRHRGPLSPTGPGQKHRVRPPPSSDIVKQTRPPDHESGGRFFVFSLRFSLRILNRRKRQTKNGGVCSVSERGQSR